MLKDAIRVVRETGKILLRYFDAKSAGVRYKPDHSPVTDADLAAQDHIANYLAEPSGIPMISEELPLLYSQRKDWKEFWLVDPLDGTREFVAGQPEFTINIALVRHGKPVLGVIYVPMLDELFYAETGKGAFVRRKDHDQLLPLGRLKDLVVARSRYCQSSALEDFLKQNQLAKSRTFGSSLKFCRLAEGVVNLYPRFTPSYEWDIAAGHVLVKESGGEIRDLSTGLEPAYNKENLANNYIAAYSGQVDFENLHWREAAQKTTSLDS